MVVTTAPLERPHAKCVSEILTIADLSSAPEFLVNWFFSHRDVRWLGAFVNATLVGTGMLTVIGKTAWLGNIAVLPAWRGRGLGHRLTDELTTLALESGVEVVLLIATADGEPLYRSLDFEVTDTYTEWLLPAPEVNLHPSMGAMASTAPDLMLDRWAIGEDRRRLWEALPSTQGWAWHDANGLAAFWHPTLLHHGLIVSRTVSALMTILNRQQGAWVIRDGLGLTDWCVRRGARAGEHTSRMAWRGVDPLRHAGGISAGLISYACG